MPSLLLQRMRRGTVWSINVTVQLLHQTILLNSTSNLAMKAAAGVSHNLCLEVELIIIWNECWYTSQIVFNIKSVVIIYQVSLYGVSLKYVIHFESYMHILKWTAHLMTNPGGYCRFWFKTRLPGPRFTCQNGNLFGCSLYLFIYPFSCPPLQKQRSVMYRIYIIYTRWLFFSTSTLEYRWSIFGVTPDHKEWVLLWSHKLKPKNFCLYLVQNCYIYISYIN